MGTLGIRKSVMVGATLLAVPILPWLPTVGSALLLLLLGAAGLVLGTRHRPPAPLLARLRVKERVALSPGTQAALLEVEGRSYLVVYGQTFAAVRRALPIPQEVLFGAPTTVQEVRS